MGTIVKKIQELEYDELLTLGVIENNVDLTDVFKSEIRMPFNMLYKFQKEGNLNKETKEILFEIFEKLILTKQDLINQYLKLGGMEPTPTSVVEPEPIEEIEGFEDFGNIHDELEDNQVTIEKVEAVKAVTTKKATKPKKVKEVVEEAPSVEVVIPRRYGKKNVLRDIENQGGVATLAQKASLSLNKVKNLYVSLDKRIIKEIHLKDGSISEEDCKKIISAVTTLERLTKDILTKTK